MNTIEVLSCTITKPTGKQYEQAEVAYKDEKGEIRGKKIFSFSNKDVWNHVRGFKGGSKYMVQSTKNDKGFWEWTSVEDYNEGAAMQPQAAPNAPKAKGSQADFRSSEEIIRTTALEVATDVCIANKGKETVSAEQVIMMAKLFVTYIRKGEFDPFPISEGEFSVDLPDEDVNA